MLIRIAVFFMVLKTFLLNIPAISSVYAVLIITKSAWTSKSSKLMNSAPFSISIDFLALPLYTNRSTPNGFSLKEKTKRFLCKIKIFLAGRNTKTKCSPSFPGDKIYDLYFLLNQTVSELLPGHDSFSDPTQPNNSNS